MGRIKHFGLAIALIAMLSFGAAALAAPIKPDLQKILKQHERGNRTFEPAEAGWNGPETQRPQDASPNPVLEAYGPAATARSVRAALLAAAIPDPKAVLAIAVVILLMRFMRQIQQRRNQEIAVVPVPASSTGDQQKAA